MSLSEVEGLISLTCIGGMDSILDLAKFPSFEYLVMISSNLKEISALGCSKLWLTHLTTPNLRRLDVRGCGQLKSFSLNSHVIKNIDLSDNPELESLTIKAVPLETIDLTQNPKLTRIQIDSSRVTHLDVSSQSELENFYCQANTCLKELDVSKNKKLKELFACGCRLESFTPGPKLFHVQIYNNCLDSAAIMQMAHKLPDAYCLPTDPPLMYSSIALLSDEEEENNRPTVEALRVLRQKGWKVSRYMQDSRLFTSLTEEFLSEWLPVESIRQDTDKSYPLFDLKGCRVTGTPRRGIYVQNGKKYVVKYTTVHENPLTF